MFRHLPSPLPGILSTQHHIPAAQPGQGLCGFDVVSYNPAIPEVFMRNAVLLVLLSSASAWGQTSPLSAEQRATFHGRQSEAVEPFRIVANIYYVGARNIASYLIATPAGHIMIDTGTKEMHDVIRTNVAKLGFKLQDIKILLSGHAHFDHVQGHAAMKKLTGAKVMAIGEDARALEAGADLSPLGDEGWEPVKVDRVLKDGDTVALGGTTLRAVWTPGHTPGCTTWTTSAEEKGKAYSVVFQACAGPNAGVKLTGNSKFPRLVEDTLRTIQVQKTLKPDIYLPMHPESYFAGKIARIKAGETPHPLFDPAAYTKLIGDTEANFQKRVQEERAKR